MRTEEERYEQWLQKVRNTSPVLKNPKELTNAIMTEVAQMSGKRRMQQRLVSWCMSAVAGVLICFWVYETYFYPDTRQMENKEVSAKTTALLSDLRPTPMFQGRLPEMNIIEKSRYLSDILKKRRETQIWRMSIRNNFQNKSNHNLLK